jgi:hypothetical protein
MSQRWILVIKVNRRLQAEDILQDPDDGIIHQVFVQALALRFSFIKVVSHMIHFVCAVALVEDLGIGMYMDGGVSNVMMLEDIF